MRRFSPRTILAAASAALAAVLLVAGSLLLWGSTYVHNTVQGQLASQQIYFPPVSAFAHRAHHRHGRRQDLLPAVD